MTGHTKGPWVIKEPRHPDHAGASYDVYGPDWDQSAPRRDWPWRVASVTHSSPQSEANARLIAAAPDLYEALENILESTYDENTKIVARAALAKARGE